MMKNLMCSWSKITIVQNKPTRFPTNVNRTQFSPCLETAKTVKLLQSVCLQQNSTPKPLFCSQVNMSAPETKIQETYEAKTVHVKIQLTKECSFGDQIFIVGDDPMMGLWDPQNAIPLYWSDAHLWIVELDIPVGKSIRFKLVLKESNGEIYWQPGPDRILQVWETNNTITIFEDWENAEQQRVTEEEEADVVDVNNTITTEQPLAIVDEDISDRYSSCDEKTIMYTKESEATEESAIVNDGVPVLVPGLTPLPEEDEKEVTEGSAIVSDGVPVLVPGLTPLPEEDKKEVTEGSAIVSDGVPVLVPGLTPLPEENQKEEEDVKDSLPESKEPDSESMVILITPERETTTTDLENEMWWGSKRLHKILTTFGFLI